MLYTLAFNSVHTRLVFLSSIRRPSRTSAVGRSARDERTDESYKKSASEAECGRGTAVGTLSRFERRRVYSSRTSCSSGVHAGSWLLGGGGGSAMASLGGYESYRLT